MPGTFVEMGLNAEPGLGSQVSIWLGPPSSQRRMHDWALAGPGVGRLLGVGCTKELREAETAEKSQGSDSEEVAPEALAAG